MGLSDFAPKANPNEIRKAVEKCKLRNFFSLISHSVFISDNYAYNCASTIRLVICYGSIITLSRIFQILLFLFSYSVAWKTLGYCKGENEGIVFIFIF